MSMEFESLGSIPFALLSVALLLIAAAGAGRAFVSLLRLQASCEIELTLLQIAIGLNLVAFAGVVFGQLGWLNGRGPLWLLLAMSLLLWVADKKSPNVAVSGQLVSKITTRWQPVAPLFHSLLAACRSARWRRSLWLVLLPVAFTLGPALSYPTGWDELVYHEVLPRRWQEVGSPSVEFDLPYSAFPSLCEILFWLMAPLESVIAPRLLIWGCWLLGLLILIRLVNRHAAGHVVVIVMSAFMLSPATLMISANCYVESFQMLNVAAILLAVRQKSNDFGTRIERAPPLLLGILAGGTAAVKLTGLTVLLLPCLWYLGRACQDRSARPAMTKRALICLAVAIVFCLPFYGRTWVATGNPFYPYFAEWFHSEPARLEMSRFHHEIGGSFFGVRSLETFVTSPILLAFEDRLYDGSFGWQSLVLFLLAAIALVSSIRARASRLVWWPALVSAVLYVFWYLTAQQARFAVPMFLAVVVAGSLGLRRLDRPIRRLVMVILLVTTVTSLPWRTAGYYFGSWETVFGFWTWADYVDDGTDRNYLPLVEAIREHTPLESKLLLLIEHRGLYLPRANIIGTPFFQEAIFTPPEEFATADRVLPVLERNQITHLVIAKSAIGPDRAPGWWERLTPLLRGIDHCERQGRLQVIWESDLHVILAVRAARSNDVHPL